MLEGEIMKAPKAVDTKKLRTKLGMSQAVFAKTFRLNLRTVQSWEVGQAEPSGGTAVLLWLIDRIPQAIMRALKDYDDRPGGSRN
jgi:putative transcriptional regulator